MMRMLELVNVMSGIEGLNTNFLAQLLAPPPPTSPPTVAMPPTLIAIATFSSEGSNSVRITAQDNDDEEWFLFCL